MYDFCRIALLVYAGRLTVPFRFGSGASHRVQHLWNAKTGRFVRNVVTAAGHRRCVACTRKPSGPPVFSASPPEGTFPRGGHPKPADDHHIAHSKHGISRSPARVHRNANGQCAEFHEFCVPPRGALEVAIVISSTINHDQATNLHKMCNVDNLQTALWSCGGVLSFFFVSPWDSDGSCPLGGAWHKEFVRGSG